MTFSIGDFIEDTHGYCNRIDAAFIHSLNDEPRIFFIVAKVWQGQKIMDNALLLPLIRIGNQQRLIGLPSVRSKKFYMIPLNPKLRNTGRRLNVSRQFRVYAGAQNIRQEDDIVETSELVHCTWQFVFL